MYFRNIRIGSGLKQKDGTWNPKSDTEQQGWKRDSSVEKEKTWEKNEEQENRKMHSLMELEGHEEDLFGKTELLTSPEDEGSGISDSDRSD